MVGPEIGEMVHYSLQTADRTEPICLPAIVLGKGEHIALLLSVCMDGRNWRRKQAAYSDRLGVGGHRGGTWHWIRGHNEMQGCREDLD